MADKYRNIQIMAILMRIALYGALALAVVGVAVSLSGCAHRQVCRAMGDC